MLIKSWKKSTRNKKYSCNCFVVFGGGDTCDSEKSVNSGYGKGYVYLTKSKDELKREFLNIKVNYKMNKFKVMVMSECSVML